MVLSAALVVHKDDGDSGLGGERSHLGITAEGPLVIYYGCTGGDGLGGYAGVEGVDANRKVRAGGKRFDDGNDADELFPARRRECGWAV